MRSTPEISPTTIRRKPLELAASDGFGALPPSASARRNRGFTRGLCTFLLWSCRRASMLSLRAHPSQRPAATTLRAVNE